MDVGGSAVKLGTISAQGTDRAEDSVPVRPGDAAEDVFARVAPVLVRLAGGTPRSVGIGLPGLLDRAEGRIRRSPNLPWLEGVPVARLLGAAVGLDPERVELENDANAAALGEQWLGAARGLDDLVLLTLGTGIGGGLILAGRLYRGAGLAGEVGHLVLEPAGLRCGCGSRGCLETLASASAARRRARERGLPPEAPGDLELLAARARACAGAERELFLEVGYDLGRGLAQLVVLLDVRTFVLGGGFAAALELLEPGIRRALGDGCYGERVDEVRLLGARLGNSAGWIGAARLAGDLERHGLACG
jgi:glucokinase